MSARRLFLALPLPEVAKAELNSLVHALKRSKSGVRWVRPDQLHVTLRFLGDVEDAECDRLLESLKGVSELAPFAFNLAGIGAFPDRRRPRVVWTGIDSGREQVKALAVRVEKSVVAAGLPPENRPFSPHLTLGRVKEPGDFAAFWQAADRTSFAGKPVHAVEVRLIWSFLTPAGPQYRDVESFPLRGRET